MGSHTLLLTPRISEGAPGAEATASSSDSDGRGGDVGVDGEGGEGEEAGGVVPFCRRLQSACYTHTHDFSNLPAASYGHFRRHASERPGDFASGLPESCPDRASQPRIRGAAGISLREE